MNRIVLLAASLLMVGFATSQDEKPKGDLALLQGAWQVWLNPDESVFIEVKGKTFAMSHQKAKVKTELSNGTLVFPEQAGAKALDWVEVKSSRGEAGPDNRCIYELHGDTWILIGGGPDKRPDQFYSGAADGNQTFVLKRVKMK